MASRLFNHSNGLKTLSSDTPIKSSVFLVTSSRLFIIAVAAITASASLIFLSLFKSMALSATSCPIA